MLLVDKGYLSSECQLDLFEKCNIRLETPMREYQKNYKNNPFFLENRERELKQFFLNYVTNLWLEEIMQNLLTVLKLKLWVK